MGTASYTYTVTLCEEGIVMPGIVQPRKGVDGYTVYLCECKSGTIPPGICEAGYREDCGKEYMIDLCERGLECNEPNVTVAWDVEAKWADGTVVGDATWTNPNLGCALQRVQLWIAIPDPSEPDGCLPGTTTDCEWRQLYDHQVGNTCLQPPCAIYPDGWPDGSLQCGSPEATEFCSQGLGTLSGLEEEVHFDQRLTPGASFWLFGQVPGGDWLVLGVTPYQSDGADGGAYTVAGGGTIYVNRGNLGTRVHAAKNVDWTDYSTGQWGHVMKQGCPPAQRMGVNDRYSNETVCDSSSNLWVLPTVPTQDLGS